MLNLLKKLNRALEGFYTEVSSMNHVGSETTRIPNGVILLNWLLKRWHVILLFLFGLTPLLWFKEKYMQRSEEVGFLNYSYLWEKFLYGWSSHLNNGAPATVVDHIILYPVGFFYKVASVLGIPNYLIQRLFLVLVYWLIIYSIYKLIYYFSKDKVISFLSVLFYTLTFYLITTIFYTAKMLQLFLMPLFFYLFIRYLETKKVNYLLLNFIVLFTFQAIFCNLPIAIATFFVYLIALTYYYTTQVNLNKIIKDFKYIFYFFLTFIPVFLNVFIFYYFSVIYNRKYEKILFSILRLHTKLINIFQLFRGAWWEPQAVYNPWQFFYDNPFIILISFVLFGFVFIGLFKRKENTKLRKEYLFWSLFFLFFMFLTHGAEPPFSFIYDWMYYKLPYFALFREPWAKFSPLLIFSSTVLFAHTLRTLRNYKKIVYPLIFLLVLIHGSILFSNRVFNHKNPGPGDTDVLVPQYWFEARDWSKEHKNDNILALPVFFKYYYYHQWYKDEIGNYNGNLHYTFLYSNSISNDYSNGPLDKAVLLGQYNPKILPLWNIRYILNQKEITAPEKIKTTIPLEDLQKDGVVGPKPYKTFGELDIYEVSERYLLPHFYIPQKIIYSDGDLETLAGIMNFGDWEIRSGIYLAPEIDGNKIETDINKEILETADEVFVGGLKNAIGEDELAVQIRPISMPHVGWSPNSFLYSLALKKEDYDKWQLRKDPEKLFENHLLYANKRIAEMVKYAPMLVGMKNNRNITERYREEMEEAIKETKETRGIKEIGKLRAYLEAHRRIVDQLDLGEDFKERIRAVFDDLGGEIAGLETKRDFSRLVYKVKVPQEGNYEIFIKGNKVETTEINGNQVQTNGEWVKFGEGNLEKGEQELVLPVSGISENLIDDNLRIKDYQPGAIYRISFDYKAPKGAGFFIAEGKSGETVRTDLVSTGDIFSHFEMFFKSSSEVADASVHLSISVAGEENLKVERIYQPEIILKSSPQYAIRNPQSVPKITFVEINSTKYRVNIEGASQPYMLVFSESFHPGWKAYIQNVKCDDGYGKVTAGYFNGEINEGTHKDVFLDKNTFETWGKEPLAEEKHLLVNGYANSWYIKPEDTGGRENYELIIEYWPQRLFYISLSVSLATLLGCLGYLGMERIKKLTN